MTAKSHLRGHEIEYNGKEWVYSDTKEPTVTTHGTRACGHCGEMNTPEGHDSCLGTLPNVMNACCGHGDAKEAYVQRWDKSVVSGDSAINLIKELKGELQ